MTLVLIQIHLSKRITLKIVVRTVGIANVYGLQCDIYMQAARIKNSAMEFIIEISQREEVKVGALKICCIMLVSLRTLKTCN